MRKTIKKARIALRNGNSKPIELLVQQAKINLEKHGHKVGEEKNG